MQAFSWFIAGVLALGILPSFTALSWQITKDFPTLGQYMGPINLIKIYAPFFLVFIWTQRQKIDWNHTKILLLLLKLVTVFSVIAWIPCGFPSTEMRDWAILVIGLLSAFTLTLLSSRQFLFVLFSWATLVFGFGLIDLAFPSVVDWFYLNIFDPQTPITDFEQTKRRVLTGVFSRQSMGKFLSWIPWLVLAASFRYRLPGWVKLIVGALAIVSTGATLATTQRAPFAGAVLGWFLFMVHQSVRVKDHMVALVGGTALLLSLLVTLAVVPNELIIQRFAFVGNLWSERKVEMDGNFRGRVFQITTTQIATHPLGNACIQPEEFSKVGLSETAHSHNLFLQQFLARGWIWGLVHFFMWVLVWLGFWKMRTPYGSAMLAGVTSILVGGMTDHPWFPINHSLVIWTFVLLGLQGWRWDSKGRWLVWRENLN